jgi:hypothetical protein
MQSPMVVLSELSYASYLDYVSSETLLTGHQTPPPRQDRRQGPNEVACDLTVLFSSRTPSRQDPH